MFDVTSVTLQFSKLKYLYLDGTPISDASIDYLISLNNLETLSVTNTDITDEGIVRLRHHFPRATIRDNKTWRLDSG